MKRESWMHGLFKCKLIEDQYYYHVTVSVHDAVVLVKTYDKDDVLIEYVKARLLPRAIHDLVDVWLHERQATCDTLSSMTT